MCTFLRIFLKLNSVVSFSRTTYSPWYSSRSIRFSHSKTSIWGQEVITIGAFFLLRFSDPNLWLQDIPSNGESKLWDRYMDGRDMLWGSVFFALFLLKSSKLLYWFNKPLDHSNPLFTFDTLSSTQNNSESHHHRNPNTVGMKLQFSAILRSCGPTKLTHRHRS